MIRLIFAVLACVACLTARPASALDPTRTIAQFHHTAWSTEDGLPADVWSIVQTPDGYLWLGSINGLYRFDGVSVERMAADLLPSPSIHALAVTPSGGLWIGYERPIGVMSLLENGVVTNFPIDAPTSTSIHSIALGPDDTVWASTAESILKFDGKRWRAIESDWGSSLGDASGGVWAFGVSGDGVVWSRNRDGLFFLRPGANRFARAQGFVGGVASFTSSPDGRLWTTDSGRGHLYALPGMQDIDHQAVPTSMADIALSEPLRGAILLDQHGTLWFTSSSGGGLRRATAQARDRGGAAEPADRFTSSDGLSSDVVHALFEDREGNIWVGTNLGLDRFRPANVVAEPTIPAGFRSRFVRSTLGALYAYTGWSSSVTHDTDGSESLYRILPNQPPQLLVRNVGHLRSMFVDEGSGEIWLTTAKGMQQLQGGVLGPPIPLPDGVNGESVYSAVRDRRGAYWISAFRHGVFRREGGVWRTVPLRPARPATGVLVPDPSGDMWVRYGGRSLFRVSGEAIHDYADMLPDIGEITVARIDAHGLLLAGEMGLARLDGETFFTLPASRDPAFSVVTGIDQTSDGSTWLFTQGGILRINTDALEAALRRPDAPLKYDLIGPQDGLLGAAHGGMSGSTVAAGPDGRVWFTTGQGLVWVDPNNLYHNPLPPPVMVRAVTANGRAYPSPVAIELPAGTRNLQVDYAALSLTIPERNRFRYKMEGVDQDWVDAGGRRQAFYTNLRPGAYRFQVIAANNDGVWNQTGSTFSITIAPTFFESVWFIALCAMAAAAGLWWIYSLRLRQATGRIRERLEERMTERERIARELHDTLLQGFQGLILRFQVVMEQIPSGHAARRLMDDVLDRADKVLEEGRDSVSDLRLSKAGGGLSDALISVVGQLPPDCTASVNVVTERKPRDIHPIVLTEMSAIGKEALFNAAQHARASRIDAVVTYGPRALSIRISDNGVGISQETQERGEREGHFGLIGMRERAKKIRAQLSLKSGAGVGTVVTVVVPGRIAYASEGRSPGVLGRLFRLKDD